MPLLRGDKTGAHMDFAPGELFACDIKAAGAPDENVKLFDRAARRHRGADWFGPGCDGEEQILEKTFGGAAEQRDIVDRLSKKIQLPRLAGIRRRKVWSDLGSEVSMTRLYEGSDRFWRGSKAAYSPAGGMTSVEVLVQVSAAWHRTPDQIMWRGAAALALADALTEAGYSTAILGVCSTHDLFRGDPYPKENRRGVSHITIPVKGWGDPINIGALAIMIFPFYLRYWGFKAMSMYPTRIEECYGYVDDTLPLPDVLKRDTHHQVWMCNIYSEEEAIQSITDNLSIISPRDRVLA